MDIQDLYQKNDDLKKYVDHWAVKEGRDISEVLSFEITRLYAQQLLEKEEITYEYQDNGIGN